MSPTPACPLTPPSPPGGEGKGEGAPVSLSRQYLDAADQTRKIMR